MPALLSESARLEAARNLCLKAGKLVGAPLGVRLWDDSVIPLGAVENPDLQLEIAGPGVLGSLLRKPAAGNLLRWFASGGIDFRGGELFDVVTALRGGKRGKRIDKQLTASLLKDALPLLLTPAPKPEVDREFAGDSGDQGASAESSRKRIAFHYDVPSEFFGLFLGRQMQYSSAVYADPDWTLEQAQHEKLDRICRKLDLQPDEQLLDVGCGWGGLMCHAAEHFGVRATGITLSEEQRRHALDRIRAAGLEDRVKVEICHYADLKGRYDKVVSIEMCEHVGVENLPTYFRKLRNVLPDRGKMLIQATARRAKMRRGRPKPSRDTKLLQKYLLPGIEVIEVGGTQQIMEACGLEIHHVEQLREHYAPTAREWARRLWQQRDKAIELTSRDSYRLWLALLTGLAVTYADGSNQVFQILASSYRKRR